jgi:hypothetical protein
MAAMLLSVAVHWCKGNLGSVLLGTLFWASPPSNTIRSESTHDRDSLVPVRSIQRRLSISAQRDRTSVLLAHRWDNLLPSIQFVGLVTELLFGAPLDRNGYADLTVLSAN